MWAIVSLSSPRCRPSSRRIYSNEEHESTRGSVVAVTRTPQSPARTTKTVRASLLYDTMCRVAAPAPHAHTLVATVRAHPKSYERLCRAFQRAIRMLLDMHALYGAHTPTVTMCMPTQPHTRTLRPTFVVAAFRVLPGFYRARCRSGDGRSWRWAVQLTPLQSATPHTHPKS